MALDLSVGHKATSAAGCENAQLSAVGVSSYRRLIVIIKGEPICGGECVKLDKRGNDPKEFTGNGWAVVG
jgi:hypothetical protein